MPLSNFAVIDDLPQPPRVAGSSVSGDERVAENPRRLVLDMDRLCDPDEPIEIDDPLREIWQDVRWRGRCLPGGRLRPRVLWWAVARQLLEERAVACRRTLGVHEVIDAELVAAIDRAAEIVDSEPSTVADPIRMRTRPARVLGRWSGRWRGLARHVVELGSWTPGSLHSEPVTTGADPRSDEEVLVGPGWVETESGRRRTRSEVVTLVFREPDGADRLDVRLVAVERVVRWRFAGVEDPAFQAFWSRWTR